jgi:type IV pilus biogenesis protein CpaD/CtpE
MNKKILVTTAIAAGFIAGCAAGPERAERDFGNSVRAANQAQVLNPVSLRNPDMTPIDQTDGQRIENVVDNYRADVSIRPTPSKAEGAIGDE